MSHNNLPPSDGYHESFPNGLPEPTSTSSELTKWLRELSPKNKAWLALAGVALAAIGLSSKDQFDHGYKAWNKTICYDWHEATVGQKQSIDALVTEVIAENQATVTAENAHDIATIIGQANPSKITNSPADNSLVTAEKTIQLPSVCKAT